MAKIGLKDLYIADVTKNDASGYTAGTPEILGKVATLKKDYKGSSEPNYYDDRLESTTNGQVEKSIEVEVKELTQAMEAKLNGHTIVKGMRVENTDDIIKDFAVGYRKKDQTGKYEFTWHYVCTPEPFGSEHDTQNNKPKIANRKIKFALRAREIDNVDSINIDELALEAGDTEATALLTPVAGKIPFFTTVPEPLK